jgi:hypothetical protein
LNHSPGSATSLGKPSTSSEAAIPISADTVSRGNNSAGNCSDPERLLRVYSVEKLTLSLAAEFRRLTNDTDNWLDGRN